MNHTFLRQHLCCAVANTFHKIDALFQCLLIFSIVCVYYPTPVAPNLFISIPNVITSKIPIAPHVEVFKSTYGPRARSGPPSKIIRPAATLPNCSNCTARLVVLHFTILPSLQFLGTTYEKRHCTINVLCVGIGMIFFQGVPPGEFSKIFPGGSQKWWDFFSHSKLRKQSFLLKFSKSRVRESPLPLPTPMVLYVVFCAFVINCENQERISLKFNKFPSFTDIL